MERNGESFKTNSWFMHDQGVSFSCTRFHCEITFIPIDDHIDYQLDVYWDGRVALTFVFPTFFETAFFTQSIIPTCTSLLEIHQKYQELMSKKKNGDIPIQKVYKDQTTK